MILLVHYLHILAIAQTVPMPRGFDDVGQAMASRLHTSEALAVYYLLLATFTVPYVFFISIFARRIKNLILYSFYAPIYYAQPVAAAAGCLFMVQFTVFPFGGVYIGLLPCILEAHLHTLQRINMEGAVL